MEQSFNLTVLFKKLYYMFDFVKKIVSKKQHTEQNNSVNLSNNVVCSINIELYDDNDIGIKYFWPKFDSQNHKHLIDIAQSFGTMLYLLNHGHIKFDMVETLSRTIDVNNKYDYEFTEETFRQWLSLINKNNNDPIVSPSIAFKQYKQ